jgi:Fe-S cluster assembly scaffold protein SufB
VRGGSTGRLALALMLAAPALALSGCETTAEKSAKLERAAKRVSHTAQSGLTISHPSAVVKVLSREVVNGSEGAAVVLTLRNPSATALAEVPIAVSLKNASGASVYSNATPGLARTLTSIALLPAHTTTIWVDDQIQAHGAVRVDAVIGEGRQAQGSLPSIAVHGATLAEGSAEGTLVNGSSTAQSELVVYAVARRGGRIVAAGRAVLASLDAGASSPFQVFFIGDTSGAQLQLSAPPTSVG